jgi:hypothetical protein
MPQRKAERVIRNASYRPKFGDSHRVRAAAAHGRIRRQSEGAVCKRRHDAQNVRHGGNSQHPLALHEFLVGRATNAARSPRHANLLYGN